MSVLSNTDIQKRIAANEIIISHFDEKSIYPASYKFKLGPNLLRPIGNDIIDFKKKLLPEYEELRLTDAGYILQPEEFILGQTLEKLTLPDDLCMIIEGRTLLARVGIEVVQTSTFIEPNHTDSIITLEIKNSGKSPFVLYEGMDFCKGYFMQLTSDSDDSKFNQGTYVTQEEVEPPKLG